MKGSRSSRVARVIGVGLACSLFAAWTLATPPAGAQADPSASGKAYVEQFYPLWFSYHQTLLDPKNHLIGPDHISPLYQTVVAINNDTLYVSSPVDLATEPVIMTVPETTAGYSVLTLDPYGSIFDAGVPSKAYGVVKPTTVYGLIPPGYAGTLPAGVTPIQMPLVYNLMIVRIDKFSPAGVDVISTAEQFRGALKMQGLSGYQSDPAGGATGVVPESYFAVPYKTLADELVKNDPVTFLGQLQTAVHSSKTPPLSPQQQVLSDEFDALFGASDKTALADGARSAHAGILSTYLDHRGANNWIHFTNIGDWGDQVVQRSAITEFIQYGNGIKTAAYYQAFVDGAGQPLVGTTSGGYTLTFPAGGQPPAERFWSLTAYTPESIELIPNTIDKYEVASYTPGLQANADGSVTIAIAKDQPPGVPTANWLPVSERPFNVMLRAYGVGAGSSLATNTYVPPPVLAAAAAAPTTTTTSTPAAVPAPATPVPVSPSFTG